MYVGKLFTSIDVRRQGAIGRGAWRHKHIDPPPTDAHASQEMLEHHWSSHLSERRTTPLEEFVLKRHRLRLNGKTKGYNIAHRFFNINLFLIQRNSNEAPCSPDRDSYRIKALKRLKARCWLLSFCQNYDTSYITLPITLPSKPKHDTSINIRLLR